VEGRLSVTEAGSIPPASSDAGGIRVRNVAKTFPGTMALRGIDLDLRPGEVHALLGANGSGKSTLVKILSGYQDADAGGEVWVSERPLQLGSPQASYEAGCRFVHQDLALVDDMSVADNIMLTSGWPRRLRTISRRRVDAEVRASLGALGADISPDTLVGTLSPAMRTIVVMTRALRADERSDAGIVALILDEPTATLPQHEVAVLTRVIREVARQGTAVMVISHHLQEALDLADVVTVLRDGTSVLSARSSSLTRDSVITAMMGEDYEAQVPDRFEATSAEVVLSCESLLGPTFADISFDVRRGEVVGIAGLEGSGRDDLLGAIFGADARLGGQVSVGGTALPPHDIATSMGSGLAYVPADRPRSAAIPELTARENLTVSDLATCSRRGVINRADERRTAADWFDRVGVHPAGATEQRLATFSGGNQQKIMLARCMRLRPSVLLLDEPTQGIDVAAQGKLHTYLLEAVQRDGMGVLISSSDEEELSAICHRVLIMRRGRIVSELAGHAISPAAITNSTSHITVRDSA
jgi:ribose transport system ATP-binding protein